MSSHMSWHCWPLHSAAAVYHQPYVPPTSPATHAVGPLIANAVRHISTAVSLLDRRIGDIARGQREEHFRHRRPDCIHARVQRVVVGILRVGARHSTANGFTG